jgi:anti-sigma factor RsiW
MEDERIHELSAAYALDALDPAEREEFERHLAGCERCREDVASFTETAAALAYAAPAATPSPELRKWVLQSARAEGAAVVVPLRRRRLERAGAFALIPAAAAVAGLGVWAGILHGRVSSEQRARAASEQVATILSDPAALRRPLHGARGDLVVAANGRAVLVVRGLAPPPAGSTYEAWVVAGRKAQPAGLFARGQLVLLTRPVAHGEVVAVTVEPSGGSAQPTQTPFASSSPI